MGDRESTSAPDAQEWAELVRRVLSGAATPADAEAVQSGVIDGRLLFTSSEQSVESKGDIVRSVILVGNQRVQIGLGDDRLENLRQKLFSKVPGLPPPFPSLLFVGREADMGQIRERLIRPAGHNLLIVRGWPGIGKTTVVSALGRDRRLMEHFPDGVLWTALGPSPSLLSAMAAWGSALGTDSILRAPTIKSATDELALLLESKKMLLLVDDVFDAAHLAQFLAARGPQCMVAATTREPQVAESFTSNRCFIHELPLLDEDYAVELFQAIAPEVAQQYPSESRELVRALERLPLAIHVAARLLSAELKYGWGIRDLIEEIGSKVVEAQATDDRVESGAIPTVSAILRKSTDRLSPEMRDYFAFLGVFAPKPATFDLAAMSAVWEREAPKPIARELVRRGLLERIGEGRFQMHALLVAHAHGMLD